MGGPLEARSARAAVPARAVRALQLLPDLSPSRTARRVLTFATALDPNPLIASAGGRLEASLRRAGGRHLPLDPARTGFFRAPANQALLDQVAAEGVELIHAHDPSVAAAAQALADAAGLPLISSCHRLPPTPGPLGRRAARLKFPGQTILVHSEAAARELSLRLRLSAGDVRVVPPPFDLQPIDQEQVSTPRTVALAERWGVVEDARPVVLVPDARADAAWIAPFVTAIEASRKQLPLWVFLATGGAPAPAPAALLTPGLIPHVHWVEEIDDYPAALKLASVIVAAPDPDDTVSEATLEALALGRPLVAIDQGPIFEVLPANSDAALVPPDNPRALADAVGAAIRTGDGRRAAARAGQQHVRSQFTVDSAAEALSGIYGETARG